MKLTVDKTTRDVPFSEIEAWCVCRGELFRKLGGYDDAVMMKVWDMAALGSGDGIVPNAWSTKTGLSRIELDVLCQPVTVTEIVCEEIP